jgi:hypothetical protein
MVLVTSSSHSRSASSAMSSTPLKNFTALVFGLPNGRSLPAVTRIPTSSGVKLKRFRHSRELDGTTEAPFQFTEIACGIEAFVKDFVR